MYTLVFVYMQVMIISFLISITQGVRCGCRNPRWVIAQGRINQTVLVCVFKNRKVIQSPTLYSVSKILDTETTVPYAPLTAQYLLKYKKVCGTSISLYCTMSDHVIFKFSGNIKHNITNTTNISNTSWFG